MRFALLLRDNGDSIELHNFGEIDAERLPQLAEVALKEGFHLMFECDAPPDMQEIKRMIRQRDALASLPYVKQLWVLES